MRPLPHAVASGRRGMSSASHRIALFKLEPADDASRAQVATSVRDALSRRGFDADVGLPADEASAKSWDLSVVVRSTLTPALLALDVGALVASLPGVTVVVQKTWVFNA